jgi:hypothetical protein
VRKFKDKQWEESSEDGKVTEVEETCDIVAFAREKLAFDPDEKQEMVLRGGRRGIVNCARSGESLL